MQDTLYCIFGVLAGIGAGFIILVFVGYVKKNILGKDK